ncbi:MAG: hypothetical protein EP339_00590 [Gammaproteobacteria bacterium]|nr:MAG: hypothetical protein EP339_00590 [Gammaproteobacteria bacterium]
MPDELLNETMFRNLAHAHAVILTWAADHNEERPHSALGYQAPKAFAESQFSVTVNPAARSTSSAR